jgi:hypothetical protein
MKSARRCGRSFGETRTHSDQESCTCLPTWVLVIINLEAKSDSFEFWCNNEFSNLSRWLKTKPDPDRHKY